MQMSGVKSRQSSYLRIALNPRSLLQHRRQHVPRLRRNVLHLCAEFFTFQYVHLHTEVTIMFLDMAPEGLQVLVAKLLSCGDRLGKAVLQRGCRSKLVGN